MSMRDFLATSSGSTNSSSPSSSSSMANGPTSTSEALSRASASGVRRFAFSAKSRGFGSASERSRMVSEAFSPARLFGFSLALTGLARLLPAADASALDAWPGCAIYFFR